MTEPTIPWRDGLAEFLPPVKKTQSIIRHVSEGNCPFCDEGPFRAIGRHTYGKHGLTAEDARDRLGLTKADWRRMNQAGKRREETP